MVNQDSRKESDFLQYLEVIRDFCADVSQRKIAELFQVTDGKKIGTYIERECRNYLEQRTGLTMEGSAALGKDLPLFNIDIKYLRKEIGVDEIIGRLEEKLGITEVADLSLWGQNEVEFLGY